ncbi:MAG: CAP domain-containing protein [Patescibacteria group bacterium]
MISKIITTLAICTLLVTGFTFAVSAQSTNYYSIPNLNSNLNNPARYFSSEAQAIQEFQRARQFDPTVKHKGFTLPWYFKDMSVSDLSYWLLNNERINRGLTPLAAPRSQVNNIAQNYSNALAQSGQFTHTLNGTTPWGRMDQDPLLKSCREFNPRMESLYKFSSKGLNISDKLKVLHAFYNFIYVDATSNWGHRQHLLVNYSDNHSVMGSEGFIGTGLTNTIRNGWNETYFVIETIDPLPTCKL